MFFMYCSYVVFEYVYVNGQFIVHIGCMFVFYLEFVTYFVCFGLSECDAFFTLICFTSWIHNWTLSSVHPCHLHWNGSWGSFIEDTGHEADQWLAISAFMVCRERTLPMSSTHADVFFVVVFVHVTIQF